MSWREQLVVRILLLVARIAATDDATRREIVNLANHVQATAPSESS